MHTGFSRSYLRSVVIAVFLVGVSAVQAQALLHYWNFNQPSSLLAPSFTTGGSELSVSLGEGSAAVSDTGQSFAGANAIGADGAGSHLRVNNPLGSILTLKLPTLGAKDIVVRYETRRSGSGAGEQVVSYSVDGSTYVPFQSVTVQDAVPAVITLDFSSISAVANNPNFSLRIGFNQAGGGSTGNNRFDNLTVVGSSLAPQPRIVINEVVSSNAKTVADEDGDFEDWIELYNPGTDAVDLSQWGLSDNPSQPFKWRFPSVVLEGGQYLLVWASGKDRKPDSSAPVSNPALWLKAENVTKRIVGGDAFVTTWTDPSTNRSMVQTSVTRQPQWIESGIGGKPTLRFDGSNDYMSVQGVFWPGEEFTIFSISATRGGSNLSRVVYDITPMSAANLKYELNDKIVASIQQTVTRGSISTIDSYELNKGYVHSLRYSNGTVLFNNEGRLVKEGAVASGGIYSHSGVMVGGYGALNGRWMNGDISELIIYDRALKTSEIRNVEFYLGLKYSLAPFAGLHTNYSISASGETLQLTRPDGTVQDSMEVPPLRSNLSYGRKLDGSGMAYFLNPTPAAANASQAYAGILAAPELSAQSGFYSSSVNVSAVNAGNGTVIRYSTNGAKPTEQSPILDTLTLASRQGETNGISMIPTASGTGYWGWNGGPTSEVLKIHSVRFQAFKEGFIPSAVKTATYVVGPDVLSRYELPVLSLAAAPDDLFDSAKGLFVNNNYNRSGDAWEREMNFELLADNDVELNVDLGVRIHGGNSRNAQLKSLRFYARGAYGTSEINHRLFKDKATSVYETFILRSGGSDWGKLPFRDALSSSLIQDVSSVDVMRDRPVAVFINGEYWGVESLRDRLDAKYLKNNYGIENVDMLSDISTVDEGDASHYLDLLTYLRTQNINESGKYEYVQTQMDTDNFRDYHLAQTYYMNIDQPGKNVTFWRSKAVNPSQPKADGRWRWMMFDCDMGMNYGTYASYDRNALVFNTGLNSFGATTVNAASTNPSWAPNGPDQTFPLRALLKSDKFRIDFINRAADLLNTAFREDVVLATIDRFRAMYVHDIDEHLVRWGLTRSAWDAEIAGVRTFAQNRPTYMRNHFVQFFGLSGTANLTVNASGGAGSIQVNTLTVNEQMVGHPNPSVPFPWTGIYFKGVPVTLKAIAPEGLKFSHWTGDVPAGMATEQTLTISLSANASLTAVFESEAMPELTQYWNFNNTASLLTPAGAATGAQLTISLGASTEVTSGTANDFAGANAQGADGAGAHLRLNNPLGAAMTLKLPTRGMKNIVVSYETRRSGQGAAIQKIAYTIDGTNYVDFTTVSVPDGVPVVARLNFTGIVGVDDNANFGVRITFEQGTGGTAGNNRFDNITVFGVPLPVLNSPPVKTNIDLGVLAVVAGSSTPMVVSLGELFTDPDGDVLSYTAASANSALVTASVVGAQLDVSGLAAGETTLTVSANDGHHDPVTSALKVLVYPAPQALAVGSFTFQAWEPSSAVGSYPTNMLFVQTSTDVADATLTDSLDSAYGAAYSLTSGSRFNGLGASGVSVIKTGSGRGLGGMIAAIDTRGVDSAKLAWTAGTVTSNPRSYALLLQYRVGVNGVFQDLLDNSGQPIQYVAAGTGDSVTYAPIALPGSVLGQPYVQLLWRYHYLSGASGARSELRLDDITIEPAGYTAWALSQFGADANNPAIAGPMADPDEDNLPNLLEFALGLDPRAIQATVGVIATTTVDGLVYPTFSYERRIDRGGVIVSVEVASSVDFAGSVSVTSGEVSALGNGLERVVIRSPLSLTSAPNQFFRLKASQP